MVEAEIMRGRPTRGGRIMPVEESDFTAKSALYLPQEAQYDYLLHLPADIAGAGIRDKKGNKLASLGAAINNAMALIEEQSDQLSGVLPRSYTEFTDTILAELLRIFNNSDLDAVGGDVIGRIYEYFLNKFAKNIASDDGVFFTPKSLVKMIVNILAPTGGVLLDIFLPSLIQSHIAQKARNRMVQAASGFLSFVASVFLVPSVGEYATACQKPSLL